MDSSKSIVKDAYPQSDSCKLRELKRIQVYENRTFNIMQDVRFKDPYALNKASAIENKLVLLGEAPKTQQQEQSFALFNLTTLLEYII